MIQILQMVGAVILLCLSCYLMSYASSKGAFDLDEQPVARKPTIRFAGDSDEEKEGEAKGNSGLILLLEFSYFL